MNQRIHDCLDGRLPRTELSRSELRELESIETVLEGSMSFIRESTTSDVVSPVMTRIGEGEASTSVETEAAGWAQRLREWIWEPRTVRLRPVWAVAGVALLLLGIGLRPSVTDTPNEADLEIATTSVAPTVYVRFELEAADASSVRLAGSFSEWEPRIELAELTPGHWSAMVPLRAGVHDYAFLVDDDRWMADPDAIQIRDGFGGTNSRITLLPPESGRDERTS